jgi:hypothetical protein
MKPILLSLLLLLSFSVSPAKFILSGEAAEDVIALSQPLLHQNDRISEELIANDILLNEKKDEELLSGKHLINSGKEGRRIQQINKSLRVAVAFEILISLIVFLRFAMDYMKSNKPHFKGEEISSYKFS